jgi:hypothetical protein
MYNGGVTRAEAQGRVSDWNVHDVDYSDAGFPKRVIKNCPVLLVRTGQVSSGHTTFPVTAWFVLFGFHFAFLVDPKFLVFHLVGDLLASLNLSLANPNFLIQYRLFFDTNSLLREWDTNFLIPSNPSTDGLPRAWGAFHNQFFAGDWNLNCLVLRNDVFTKPHFSALYPFFVSAEHLATKLDALLSLDSGGSRN